MTALADTALLYLLLTTIRAWTPSICIFYFLYRKLISKKRKENTYNLGQVSFLCDCIRVATVYTICSVSFISLSFYSKPFDLFCQPRCPFKVQLCSELSPFLPFIIAGKVSQPGQFYNQWAVEEHILKLFLPLRAYQGEISTISFGNESQA